MYSSVNLQKHACPAGKVKEALRMLLSSFLLLAVYDNHALLVVSTCVVQNNGPSLHLQKACNDLQVFCSRLTMHYISCKYVRGPHMHAGFCSCSDLYMIVALWYAGKDYYQRLLHQLKMI